jgi:hypothetical protein
MRTGEGEGATTGAAEFSEYDISGSRHMHCAWIGYLGSVSRPAHKVAPGPAGSHARAGRSWALEAHSLCLYIDDCHTVKWCRPVELRFSRLRVGKAVQRRARGMPF